LGNVRNNIAFYFEDGMDKKKLQTIEKILVDTDPVRLIVMGAPKDEYHHEAIMIYERVNRYTLLGNIHQIVWDVFVEQFGGPKYSDKIIGKFDSYGEIAKQIKEVLNAPS
jgi:hypothetical protein